MHLYMYVICGSSEINPLSSGLVNYVTRGSKFVCKMAII